MTVRVTSTRGPARVVVDPNSFVPGDSSLSFARFADADRLPAVGDIVWAIQPDDDGTEGIAPGHVVDILPDTELLVLRVIWTSFTTQWSQPVDFSPDIAGWSGTTSREVADAVARSGDERLHRPFAHGSLTRPVPA